MALLLDAQNERSLPLAASSLLGSSPQAFVRLEGAGVSEAHALIRWQGHAWILKDLGSRNGTFVGAKRLEPGGSTPVYASDELSFGGPDCRWRLADDGPPEVLARNLRSGDIVCARDGMLALPEGDAPLAVALRDRRGVWTWEQEGAVHALGEAPQVVVVGDQAWRVHPPLVQDSTTFGEGGWLLEYLTLVIHGEADAPNVRCSFVDNIGARRELPHRPTPYRVLALLGRAMLEDANKSSADRGWRHRDYVLSELDAHQGILDSWVFWCRKGATRAGVMDGARIIERTHQGYLRLGLAEVVFDD